MADKSPSGNTQNDNIQKIKRIVWLSVSAWSTQAMLILVSLFLLSSFAKAGEVPATCDENCPAPFVVNQFWTTEYGPAAANVVLSPTNFLACPSSDYALCYYAGPDSSPTGLHGKKLPKLPCKVSSKDPDMADCRCYAESGDSYVDIHAIRNTEAYIETIRQCGLNGGKCRNMGSVAVEKVDEQLGRDPAPLPIAPVCNYLKAGSDGITPMEPGSEIVSTFSFAKVKQYGVEQKDCSESPGAYAGCMTASCTLERDKSGKRTGFANCKCPVYSGPYQIGQQNASCDAGSGNVWSAAYAPPSE